MKRKEVEFVKDLDRIILLSMGGPGHDKCPNSPTEGTEIWAANVTFKKHYIDRLFIGHDARLHFFNDSIDFFEDINKTGIPLYTMWLYHPVKKNALIPFQEIMEKWNVGFFLDIFGWILPTAILQNPKMIELCGIDYPPDAGDDGLYNFKGCIEFWCGVAKGSGIKVINTVKTNIMNTKQGKTSAHFGIRKTTPQGGLIETIPEEDRNTYALRNYMIVPDGEEY